MPRSSPPRRHLQVDRDHVLLRAAVDPAVHVGDAVAADRRAPTAGQADLLLGPERAAGGEHDRDRDHAGVHHETAVPARVPGVGPAQRARPADRRRPAGGPAPRRTSRATIAVTVNAASPNATTVVQSRVHATTVNSIAATPAIAGQQQPVLQDLGAGRPPRQRGRDRHEEQQHQPDRRAHAVEVRLPHRQRAAAQRLGEQREDRAEQHHEGERGEEQVVGEERGLTGDRRVDPARARATCRRATRSGRRR